MILSCYKWLGVFILLVFCFSETGYATGTVVSVKISVSGKRIYAKEFRAKKVKRLCITDGGEEGAILNVVKMGSDKEKFSFELISEDNPELTSLVNASNIYKYKELSLLKDVFRLELKKENFFIADIAFNDKVWGMVINNANRSFEINGEEVTGELSNGTTMIKVKEMKTKLGETPLFGRFNLIGFEFYMDGKKVAAVQTHTLNHNKKFLWLNDNLSSDIRFVLINACVALLCKTNFE